MATGVLQTEFSCMRCNKKNILHGDQTNSNPSGWEKVELSISKDIYLLCSSCVVELKHFICYNVKKEVYDDTTSRY
jgi:hypothetical protein